MLLCLMACEKEAQQISISTLSLRIDGRGNGWVHCNGYLIVIFVVFK